MAVLYTKYMPNKFEGTRWYKRGEGYPPGQVLKKSKKVEKTRLRGVLRFTGFLFFDRAVLF